MKKILKKAVAMAKQSIYDDAQYLGKWNGYSVFNPVFNDDGPHCIGFPQFILEKGGLLRWNKDKAESRAIMEIFWPDDD